MAVNPSDIYEISIYGLMDEVLVECVKCKNQALVQQLDSSSGIARISCKSCGFFRHKSDHNMLIWKDGFDPYFGFSLWLKTPAVGNIVWAYNKRHLDLLRSYISSNTRPRKLYVSGPRNSTVGSRLPKWISAKKNRPSILKALEKLSHK